jgi:hypothetical protein
MDAADIHNVESALVIKKSTPFPFPKGGITAALPFEEGMRVDFLAIRRNSIDI